MGNYIDEDQIKELNHHKLMMQKYIRENGDMKQDSDAFLIPDSVLKQMNANLIILNIPFTKVSMGIHEDIAWLHISKWEKTSIKIWNDEGWNKSINGYGMSFQYKFFTYGEGKIYFEGFKRKHPALIQDIVHSIKNSSVARWCEEMKKGGNKMKYKIRETVDLIIRSSAGLLSKDSVQSLMMFVAQFVSQENMDTQEPLEIKRKILKEYRIYLNWVTNNLIYFEPYEMGKAAYIVDVNNPRHIFVEEPKSMIGRVCFENKIS